MISKYFTIAIRNVRKRTLSAAINVLGLTVGMASCLLISWYVLSETSYDDFHHEANSVFRVNTYWGDDAEDEIYATTPPPLYHRLKSDVPEVEYVARAFSWNHSTMRLPTKQGRDEKVFRETEIYIVDPEFLQVLDFNIIAGNKRDAFKESNSIVITRETAKRYFGEEAIERNEVIGRSILFGGNKSERIVSAIVDPPANTHFPFDMLVSIKYGYEFFDQTDNWVWNIMHTYVKVSPSISEDPLRMQDVQNKISQIAENYGKPYLDNTDFGSEEVVFDYRLQPVRDIHLYSNFLREHQANSNVVSVQVLIVIAALIALLACINFINLSTAQSSLRAKEVAVKKLMGSKRKSLISQFMLEALAYSLTAGVLSLGLVELLREPFNWIAGKNLEFNWLDYPWFSLSILIGILLMGIISGVYPAFYLSSVHPVSALKGKIHQKGKSNLLRNGLVIFQFTVSITLIICTMVVYEQISYIQNKSLGYNRDNVLVIKNDREIDSEWKDFKTELNQLSGVMSNSFSTAVPTKIPAEMRDFRELGSSNGLGIGWMLVDEDYMSTLDMQLVQGSNFRKQVTSDLENGLILNESAIRALQLAEPIGTQIVKN